MHNGKQKNIELIIMQTVVLGLHRQILNLLENPLHYQVQFHLVMDILLKSGIQIPMVMEQATIQEHHILETNHYIYMQFGNPKSIQ